MKRHLILITTLLAVALAHTTRAGIPPLINYQGHVKDAAGTPVGSGGTPVNRTVTFRIWNHASATANANRLYAESAVVSINNGDFSVLIGQGTPTGETTTYPSLADAGVFNGTEVFLGITVDDGNPATTDAEISPRQRIVATAFAFRAMIAESVADGAITDAMLANNAVGNNQIAMNSVSTAKIAPNAVTNAQIAAGTVLASNLADNAVTRDKLIADAVTGAKIADGTIEPSDLADNAVTTAKMSDSSVTSLKIANGGILTEDLNNAAVTTDKLASNAVDINKLAVALQQALCPAGTIMAYGGTTAPAGWFMCDGSPKSQTTYATLYGVIQKNFGGDTTNFNLPDFRGRFLRGTDDPDGAGPAYTAANRDPDKASRTAMNTGGTVGVGVGSIQMDEYKAHTHTIGHENASASTGSSIAGGSGAVAHNNTTSSAGGTETRPVNAYVNYIIKY